MASPAAIIDGLAGEFRELDEIARALREQGPSSDVEREINRQREVWHTFLKRPAEEKVKIGVRAPLLERWLGERWVGRCIRLDGNDLSMSQVQQIVDSLLPHVPVERRAKGLEDPQIDYDVRVADRDAFALELAREWVRFGLPRSPVR